MVQVFLYNTNNFQTSAGSIDEAFPGTIIQCQSGPGSNGNERILTRTGISPPDSV